MQLDTDTVERMAREYSQSLSDFSISDTASNLIERIILLSENQLDIINYMLCFPQSRRCSKILNYLKTLKTASIVAMYRLLNRGDYLPPFRNPERLIGYQASYAKLVDIQIDIFILLDRLTQARENITDILILENRAMAIMGVICR